MNVQKIKRIMVHIGFACCRDPRARQMIRDIADIYEKTNFNNPAYDGDIDFEAAALFELYRRIAHIHVDWIIMFEQLSLEEKIFQRTEIQDTAEAVAILTEVGKSCLGSLKSYLKSGDVEN